MHLAFAAHKRGHGKRGHQGGSITRMVLHCTAQALHAVVGMDGKVKEMAAGAFACHEPRFNHVMGASL